MEVNGVDEQKQDGNGEDFDKQEKQEESIEGKEEGVSGRNRFCVKIR